MKLRQLFLLTALCCMGLAGCDKNNTAGDGASLETDSLEYANEKDTILQCHIKVDFPTGQDSFSLAVANYINTELKHLYLPTSMEEGSEGKYPRYTAPVTDGGAMIDFYGKANYAYLQKEAKAFQDEAGQEVEGMAYDVAIRKIEDNSRYSTYRTNTYTFLGGAHGSSSLYAVNIVKPSGRVLTQTIDTLKLKEIQPLLRKGVVSYMHKGGDSEVSEQNLNDYLFIENGIIPLPSSAPYLAPDGLHFVYQQYEIAAYAMGMPSFVVPYDEAKPFMTTEALELIK